MYKNPPNRFQLKLEFLDFPNPFGVKLRGDNRWARPDRAPPAEAGLVISVPLVPEACADGGAAPPKASDAGCVATRSVDYTADVQPIFSACSGEICHGFAVDDPAELLNRMANECCEKRSLVVPGHPEQSYLFEKISSATPCEGQRMPYDELPLDPADIQTIYDWICSGAKLP